MVTELILPDAGVQLPLVHGFCDDFDIPFQRGSKDIPLGAFQEVDGTAIADHADGAGTIPGWANETETGGLRWNNSDATAGATTFTLPRDLDTGQPAVLRIRCAKVGATNDAVNTTTFDVGLFNNALAATYDADDDYGGTSTAVVPNATTLTVQECTLAIAAADLGNPGDSVYLTLKPTSSTLDTDDIIVISLELDYVKSNQRWQILGDAASSVTFNDAAGGTVNLITGGTNEDEIYIATPLETFLTVANKPIEIGARVSYVEAATNVANICFGLAQEAAADLLVDAGAGLATTLDGALFYKVDGGARWQVGSSNATTQTTTDTQTICNTMSAGEFHNLKMYVRPISSTEAEVTFHVDSTGAADFAQCRRYGANPREPHIKHTLTLSGLAEMHLVLGAKAGSAAAETLVVDYVYAYQTR
jgi:hypothetical protein